MKISFKEVEDRLSFEELRSAYLKSLPEAQELYLEMEIWEAKPYYIIINESTVGYFQIKDTTLLEYFIEKNELPNNEQVFSELIQAYEINKILCKSFDHLTMVNALSLNPEIKEIGYLFRDFVGDEFIEDDSIEVRFGTINDVGKLKLFMDEVFDDIKELEMFLNNNNVIIFEKESQIIGYGIFHKTVPQYSWFDIGMAVHPDFRKQGYGSYIIRYMKNYCDERGWTATCGCDINNIASKKTLEKAGIYSRHRLYEFLLP